ncbi:MAG: hypothetical protein KAH84_02670 [Thiomargarita sp.]|nr:hypothetical protein [Thiomargarita sp.]
MSTIDQVERLEDAIRQRAKILANNQLSAAKQQRQKILEETNQRLEKNERQAIENAKVASEQAYRRQVQANEIKMQAELDQLRWQLIESMMEQLYEQLKQLPQQKESYLKLLKQYISTTVQQLEDKTLVVEVNQQDYDLLVPQWENIIQECAPNKECSLAVSAEVFIGGVLVRNQVDRIRINNTFEGLITRLENELHQLIASQLFASVTSTRNL